MTNCDKFRVTKILDNDLITDTIIYEKSLLGKTIKLYGINFVTDKNKEKKQKLQLLIKRKELKFELKEIVKYCIYEGNIHRFDVKLFNQEFIDENLAIPVYKNPPNVEENLKKLAKVFQEYEHKCKALEIPTIIEMYKNKIKNKKDL